MSNSLDPNQAERFIWPDLGLNCLQRSAADNKILCILGSWVIFACFFADHFFKTNFFQKNSFRNTTRMSNSLDPDQAQHFVEPDLGLNCLQKLLANNTSRQS